MPNTTANEQERAEFKLPLTGKLFKLQHLPHQPADKHYALAVGAFRQPSQKIGYLMELTGRRRGKILAWLNDGGTVYECAEPLAYLPQTPPSILLSKWSDAPGGRVDARIGADDTLRLVSQYHGDNPFSFHEPSRDLSALGSKGFGMNDFMAMCYLEFIEFPRLEGTSGTPTSAGQMKDVLTPFQHDPLPDAVDMLIFRVDTDPAAASGFERYAAWMLKCAGAERLRSVAAHTKLSLSLLNRTGLFWLTFDRNEVDEEERRVLLATESALNRLKLICDRAIQADGVGSLATFGEPYCSEQDLLFLNGVASKAPALLDRASEDNPWVTLGTHPAQPNGEWDVRTRFAEAMESLALPYRLSYRFDADVASGVLAVDITTPVADLLPGWKWENAEAGWKDISLRRPAMASAYTLRLTTLAAAAGFASGVGITRVVVTARNENDDAQALVSLAYDRIPFLTLTVPSITAGKLSDPILDADPETMLALLAPSTHSAHPTADGVLLPTEALPSGLPTRHASFDTDERPIPQALRGALRADRVCDLNIEDADTTAIETIRSIVTSSADTPIAAIAELESFAEAIDLEAHEGDKPLYCDNYAARFLIGFAEGSSDDRYRRLPDADYLVLFHLANLYRTIGDTLRAEKTGRTLCEIAPTSTMAREHLAATLVELKRFDEAAAELKRGLALAALPTEIDYLMYRLAWAMWQAGRRDAALATYQMVDENGRFARAAHSEMTQLMEQMGSERLSREMRDDALGAAGVPAAPTVEVRKRLIDACIGLTDAGLPEAAARAASMIWWIRDDPFAPVVISLREGLR